MKSRACIAFLPWLAMIAAHAPAQPVAEPLEGLWGGDRLQLVIEQAQGRIEMDCASGTIAGPLRLEKDGSFAAPGTFVQHRPAGPQRADDLEAPPKARYAGEVKGDAMRLTIQPTGASPPLEFHLRRGVRVKLVRCL